MTKTIAVRFFAYKAKQRTPSPSLVAFYDMPGKVWAVSVFFVALPAEQNFSEQMLIFLEHLKCSDYRVSNLQENEFNRQANFGVETAAASFVID